MGHNFPPGHFRPIWLASYPRSGNTFLRIVLQNFFRLPTYSVYRVEGETFRDPSAEALEEAPWLPPDWRERLTDSPEAPPLLIKSHGPPESLGAAIYLARDGRAVVDSYYHYHKKFAFEQPSLTEVIAGACQFGSWSEHYLAWQPRHRPETIFLKYEDLVGKPLECIPLLARFLGEKPLESRLPSFSELKSQFPDFFRRGRGRDFLAEWSPGQRALFSQLHGPVMEELGYEVEAVTDAAVSTVVELAQSALRSHRLYLEHLTKLGHTAVLQQECQEQLSRVLQEREQLARVNEELANDLRAKERVLQSRWVRLGRRLGLLRRREKKDSAAVISRGEETRLAASPN